MRTIKHPSGAIEKVPDETEKKSKDKYKTKKKGSDLSSAEVKDLVFELAKRNNLI